MKRKQIIWMLSISLFFLLSLCHTVLAKYEMIETKTIARLEIDRTAPAGKLTYSKEEPTKENVTVTLEVNETIKELEGWTNIKENIWEKEYTQNTNETIKIQDLSGNQAEIPIMISNIDREAPSIVVESILNSNAEYPEFASKEATIQIVLKIEDANNIQKGLVEDELEIWIEDKKIEAKQIQIELEEKEEKIEIILQNIQEEGELKIKIGKASLVDALGNKNETYVWNSGIFLDNTSPMAQVEQKIIEEGKVQVSLHANEVIREIEGWEGQEDKYTKIFENNISYEMPIKDLAGNSSKVEIEIKDATAIVLRYASHNSEVGWTFGYGNYDIAGMSAIEQKRKLRTEALAFSIEGNVEPDFLQVRAYVYNYWGEGSKAICQDTNKKYAYGFNPSPTTWKSMQTEEGLVKLNDGNQYFLLGGTGVNKRYQTDANGQNPIPPSLARQYLYGISGISFRLKDTSVYSIVYQIYIEEIGWLAPCKNEEFACYQKDKPISGLRVALIPNSEVDYLWNMWEKDTGEKIE